MYSASFDVNFMRLQCVVPETTKKRAVEHENNVVMKKKCQIRNPFPKLRQIKRWSFLNLKMVILCNTLMITNLLHGLKKLFSLIQFGQVWAKILTLRKN